MLCWTYSNGSVCIGEILAYHIDMYNVLYIHSTNVWKHNISNALSACVSPLRYCDEERSVNHTFMLMTPQQVPRKLMTIRDYNIFFFFLSLSLFSHIRHCAVHIQEAFSVVYGVEHHEFIWHSLNGAMIANTLHDSSLELIVLAMVHRHFQQTTKFIELIWLFRCGMSRLFARAAIIH